MDTFNQNTANCYEKKNSVEEGNEDGAFLIAVGVAFAGFHLGQGESNQSQDKAEDIAEIMACIGEKSQRACEKADACFYGYESEVKKDAEEKDAREILGGGNLVVVMVMRHIGKKQGWGCVPAIA